MLLGMYIIIALAFYVYPNDTGVSGKAIWELVSKGS